MRIRRQLKASVAPPRRSHTPIQPSKRSKLNFESLEGRRLLAGNDVLVDPMPPKLATGFVAGRKWEDTNADGRWNDAEVGLAGITIYADLNENRRLDRGEPQTQTSRDIPETDFNEDGLYLLELPPGRHVIREVVPDGSTQTFPSTQTPFDANFNGDELALVTPRIVELETNRSQEFNLTVAITILPFCVRPYEIDVVASSPNVIIENMTGTHLNGCGGDRSEFEVLLRTQANERFEIQFIDLSNGSVLESIPVVLPPAMGNGSHVVDIESNSYIEGLDFGNAPQFKGGTVEGLKWIDANGNGQRDIDERGLEHIKIYADLNDNGKLDRGEPSTITQRDHPTTAFDESGQYRLLLPAGEYAIREVVPNNYAQTFPGADAKLMTSETGQMNSGVAFDFDVTGVRARHGNDKHNVLLEADVDMTVVWPNSCGTLINSATNFTMVGHHLIVDMVGHQIGDVCAEVISPQTVTLTFKDLQPGDYSVVGVLHETVRDRSAVPTLTTTATISIGGAGAHYVGVADSTTVSEVNFGNRLTLRAGSIHGRKWHDENGNGQRERDERGLPGVTIYLDLNRNGQLDGDEPFTITAEENPKTRFEEAGLYSFETDTSERSYIVREVVPDGFRQTFPGPTSAILHVDTDAVNPQTAISFNLVGAEMDIATDGVPGGLLTFEVLWRNGCGALLPELTRVGSDDSSIIQVELFGKGAGPNVLCTQATVTETASVRVPDLQPGEVVSVEANLFESSRPLAEEPELTHRLNGRVSLGVQLGFHQVVVESGQFVENIDFGNRSLDHPPVDVVADINSDGTVNVADIDALAAVIRTLEADVGRYRKDHDLSGDGIVDHADFEYLVLHVMEVPFGDANLDGVFNSEDIVQVFVLGEYDDDIAGNSTWSSGDWDGDGDFTSDDIVVAFIHGQYDPISASQGVTTDAVDAVLALDLELDDGTRQKRNSA